MLKLIVLPAFAAACCLVMAGSATAQIVVPAGQDFYATPMSKDGMMMMAPSRIVTEAPPAKPMKHKMMKGKMKRRM